jgi:hypothetical protein
MSGVREGRVAAQASPPCSTRSLPACPRCGSPVSWYERARRGERYYLLAVHFDPESRSRRKCYLGPVEGYEHGSITHPMMELKGFGSDVREEVRRRADYVIGALNSLIECLEYLGAHSETEELKKLQRELKAILGKYGGSRGMPEIGR